MRAKVTSLWRPARWLLLAAVVAGAVYLIAQPDAEAQQGPRGGYGGPGIARRRPGNAPPYGGGGMYRHRGGRGGSMHQAGPRRGGGMRGPGAGMRRGGGGNLVANDDYVYVVARGTLYQFDAESLELVNKVSVRPDGPQGPPGGEDGGPGPRMRRGRPRGGQYGPPGDRQGWQGRRGRGGWRAPEEE
jgi:hypothetical protein